MPALELTDYLTRTLHLLALCLAPGWLSPDPAPSPSVYGLVAGVVLLALLWAAARLRKSLGTKLASWAAAATFVAVAAALGAALSFSGERGPLGRAVPYVAPLWWAALALGAAASADRLLIEKVRRRGAAVAAGLVLAFGAIMMVQARSLLASPEQMWARSADLEPAHERALLRLAEALAAKRDYSAVVSGADRCIAERRDNCSCHGLRGWALLRLGRRDDGLTEARTAATFCADHPLVRATLGHGLSLSGFHQEALAEVQRGWQLLAGWDAHRALFEGELHFAQALALEGTGQAAAALAEAQRAVDGGGGRDARLLAAAIAISAGELDVADQHLEAVLAVDPADPDAVYDRALVADRRGDYNRAREGYLATLRLQPAYAAARYNLAVLTWRRGVTGEAHHHVELFQRDYPADPRGAELATMIATAPAHAPPTLTLPPPPGSASASARPPAPSGPPAVPAVSATRPQE